MATASNDGRRESRKYEFAKMEELRRGSTKPLVEEAWHARIRWPDSWRSPACLTVCDMLFIPLVIAPLMLMYWWGTWLLIEELCATTNIHKGTWGLIFLAIGIVGESVYYALQRYMVKWFNVRNIVGRYVIAHVFLYIASFLSVCHWFGVWWTLDGYVAINLTNNFCIALASVVVMVCIRTFRCARAGPVGAGIDSVPDVYSTPLRWSKSKLPFLVDVIFTVAVVNSVNVVFWRCVWELQDLIILPDNLEISVIVSLVVGYVLTYLCYLLQYPLDALFRILRNEKGHCFFVCLLFVDILFTFITAFAAICTWRGLWMNFHLHMWPSQLYYSFWIGHGVGFMGLSLVGGANNIPVRGAIIDANKETGCLSIEFFRSYFAQSESDDKSPKITNTKETLVIESVSTTV